MDQGLVPMSFSRPPQGAIAGEALVVRMATQPSAAALPGEVHGGTEVVGIAHAYGADPVDAGPGHGFGAGAFGVGPGRCRPCRQAAISPRCQQAFLAVVAAFMAPWRSRSTYQGSLRTPWDWCPHRSAWVRLSAMRAASAAGTPWARRMEVARSVSWPGVMWSVGPSVWGLAGMRSFRGVGAPVIGGTLSCTPLCIQ